MPASASASLRARLASAARRAATSTSVLTTAATSRKAATAARSRSLRIVNVWMGSAKNQLRKREPGDGRERGRPEAADGRHGDDEHEVAERRAGEADVVAERGEEQREERQPDDGERGSRRAGGAAAAGVRRVRIGGSGVRSRGAVGARRDHVDVERPAGLADDPADDRPAGQLVPARPVARAEHELGGPLGAGRLHERLGHVGADDLAVGAAELLHELAVLEQRRRRRASPARRRLARARRRGRPSSGSRCGRRGG